MLYGERARKAKGRRKMRDGVVEGPKHEHAFGGQHRHTRKAYRRQARSGESRHAEVCGMEKAESGVQPERSGEHPEDIRDGQNRSNWVGNGVVSDCGEFPVDFDQGRVEGWEFVADSSFIGIPHSLDFI